MVAITTTNSHGLRASPSLSPRGRPRGALCREGQAQASTTLQEEGAAPACS